MVTPQFSHSVFGSTCVLCLLLYTCTIAWFSSEIPSCMLCWGHTCVSGDMHGVGQARKEVWGKGVVKNRVVDSSAVHNLFWRMTLVFISYWFMHTCTSVTRGWGIHYLSCCRFQQFFTPPSSKFTSRKGGRMAEPFKENLPNTGWISADRSSKATLPLTIPSSSKVVCKGFTPLTIEIVM